MFPHRRLKKTIRTLSIAGGEVCQSPAQSADRERYNLSIETESAMPNDSRKSLERTQNEIDEILRRVDLAPILDTRTADEVLGYDDDGVPQ